MHTDPKSLSQDAPRESNVASRTDPQVSNLPSQPLPAAQAQLSVQVTKPDVTQTLEMGATLPIAWISTGATTHRVQFVVPKPDGTEEITPIITDLGPVQSYTWIISQDFIPVGQQKTGRIRVVARNANTLQNVSDDSDVAITIRGQAQLSVRVTKPDMTQTLEVGATLPIAWASTGATTHRVQFVAVNPNTGTEEILPIITDLGPVQSYTWSIPSDFIPAGQQKTGRIRVVGRDATTLQNVSDDSDVAITIRGQAAS